MLKWTLRELTLSRKNSWMLAKEYAHIQKNFIIILKDEDSYEGCGEGAIEEGYDHALSHIKECFKEFKEMNANKIDRMDDLREILKKIIMPKSLSFAIEFAFLQYLSHISETSLSEILGVSSKNGIETTYRIPHFICLKEMEVFVKQNNLERFKTLKITINSSETIPLFLHLSKIFSGNIQIDANEIFHSVEDTLKFINSLTSIFDRIDFIQQPLPRHMYIEYNQLFQRTSVPIFANESIFNGDLSNAHKSCFHGVNIKLMKSGSYFKAIKQIKMARSLGLKVILGCMNETSLGISAAMHLASIVDYIDLNSFMSFVEDPFHLIEEDGGKLYYTHYH